MSDLFVKGNPYDLSINQFYLVGKNNNTYYYLTKPVLESAANCVFTSTPLLYVENYLTIIDITSIGNKLYNIIGTSVSTNSGSFIVKDEIIDINTGKSSKLEFVPQNGSLKSSDYLYPGIWYKIYNNNLEVKWKIQKCKEKAIDTQTNFCTSFTDQIDYGYLDVMLVQVNKGGPIENKNGELVASPTNFIVWKNSGCKTIYDYPSLGLTYFEAWAVPMISNKDSQPTNCQGPGKISPKSNNCAFSNLQACQNASLFMECSESQNCGECLGYCSEKFCQYDYDPKGEYPLSCNPKYDKPLNFWQKYQLYIIIAIVVVIVLLIIGISVFASWKNKKNKKNK